MHKKIFWPVFCVFLAFCTCQSLFAQTLMGDVNGDGTVTLTDATKIAIRVASLSQSYDPDDWKSEK